MFDSLVEFLFRADFGRAVLDEPGYERVPVRFSLSFVTVSAIPINIVLVTCTDRRSAALASIEARVIQA